jgi:poly(hydroxyalkanoate) granule-associated protein
MVLDPALDVARRGALAYVGALALTRDVVVDTVERFAERGSPVERAVRTRLDHAADVARQRFEQATRRLRGSSEPAAEAPTKPADLLAQGRDRLLNALNIPTQRALHDLNDQLDHLSAAIEDLRTQRRQPKAPELLKPAEAPKAPELPEPLPGYDTMNVGTVVRHLAEFDNAGLRAVRAYEQAHGNRVTVLRAIEERLALAPTV